MKKAKRTINDYFTFPVMLLPQLAEGHKMFAGLVIKWAVYNHSLKISEGSDSERLDQAIQNLEIDIEEDRNGWYDEAAKIYEATKGYKVTTSIAKEIILSYRDEDKAPDEVNALLMFAALKSMIGKKIYMKVNNRYLLSRMAGLEKSVQSEEQLPDYVKAISSRYKLNKIRDTLMMDWGLKYDGKKTRGWYATFNFSLEQLIEKVEMKRLSYHKKKYSEEQDETRKKVLRNIYGKTKKTDAPTQDSRATSPLNTSKDKLNNVNTIPHFGLDQFNEELKADTIFIQHCIDMLKSPGTAVNRNWIVAKLDNFLAHLKAKGETQKKKDDYRAHFTNWISKQEKPMPFINPLDSVY